MTREAYKAERDRLQGELAALRGVGERAAALGQAAAFLRDLPAAWDAASAEQRNDLARLVFREFEVRGNRVVAVVPQPDFAPYFVDRLREEGGGNDDTPGSARGVKPQIKEAEVTGIRSAGEAQFPHSCGPPLRPSAVTSPSSWPPRPPRAKPTGRVDGGDRGRAGPGSIRLSPESARAILLPAGRPGAAWPGRRPPNQRPRSRPSPRRPPPWSRTTDRPCPAGGPHSRTLNVHVFGWFPAFFGSWSSGLPAVSRMPVATTTL